MEAWEREYINRNLSQLMENINSDVHLVSNLQSFGVLGNADVNELYAKERLEGKDGKTKHMLEILKTRTRAYKYLAKSLYKGNQSGALLILFNGVEHYTPHQTPFEYCEIEVDISAIRSKNVVFQNSLLPFDNILKKIGTSVLQNIIHTDMNVSVYQKVISDQPLPLATNTIPTPVPYYIPRTLSLTSQLDPKIFNSLPNDKFCVEGKSLQQLLRIARDSGRKVTDTSPILADTSGDQLDGNQIIADFIVLERHDHFKNIVEKSGRDQIVHWVKYEDDVLYFVKSMNAAGNTIENYLISENQKHFGEHEFVDICLRSSKDCPILLIDSPGMGKSQLLAQLALLVKAKEPYSIVIYFVMSQLVDKLSGQGDYSQKAVKNVLVDSIAENGFCRKIIQNLIDINKHPVEIFLDGFDEVQEMQLESASKILVSIAKCENIRMYVSSRPHRRQELESKFGILGYNILPFDDIDKKSFFLKFWQKEHTIENIENVQRFAEHCIKTLSDIMASGDGDIAGIPLQCRMLAEIFSSQVKEGDPMITTDSIFVVNSIFDLYQRYIDSKFQNLFPESERNFFYRFHAIEAVNIVFSKEMIKQDKISNDNSERIFRIGILVPNKSDPNSFLFIHRTVAEFLATEYFVSAMNTSIDIPQITLLSLFFEQALTVVNDTIRYSKRDIFIFERDADVLNISRFQYPVIARFINFLTPDIDLEVENFSEFKTRFRETKYYNPKTLISILQATLVSNATNLFKFLLNLFLDADIRRKVNNCSLGSPPDNNQNWIMDCIDTEGDRDQQIINLRELVSIAAYFSSLHLTILACKFVVIIYRKQFKDFIYKRYSLPIGVALRRGHFQIFTYLSDLNERKYSEQLLLHYCVVNSYDNRQEVVIKKVQIMKEIMNEKLYQAQLFPTNNKNCKYIFYGAHLDLIKCIIEAGANISATDSCMNNIAHITAKYFSAENYHKLVDHLKSNNLREIFKTRNKKRLTPVHVALQKINLEKETLRLLKHYGQVDFNDNHPNIGSEFACAIAGGRNERVLKDIVEFGGDMKKLHSRLFSATNHVLFSIDNGNFEAVKYVISCNDSDKNKGEFPFKTPLGNALLQKNETMVKFLVDKKCDVNRQFLHDDIQASGFLHVCRCLFSYEFVFPLQYAVNANLKDSADILKRAGGKQCVNTSFWLTNCISWICCLWFWFLPFLTFGIIMIVLHQNKSK